MVVSCFIGYGIEEDGVDFDNFFDGLWGDLVFGCGMGVGCDDDVVLEVEGEGSCIVGDFDGVVWVRVVVGCGVELWRGLEVVVVSYKYCFFWGFCRWCRVGVNVIGDLRMYLSYWRYGKFEGDVGDGVGEFFNVFMEYFILFESRFVIVSY